MSVTSTTRRLSNAEERERRAIRVVERTYVEAIDEQQRIKERTSKRSPAVYRWLQDFDRRHRP
jgi:hypothetical protein